LAKGTIDAAGPGSDGTHEFIDEVRRMNKRAWKQVAVACGKPLSGSLRDLLPIIGVVLFFQLIVFQKPLPDATALVGGLTLVVIGLALFVTGLEIGLFPLGERMAHEFASRGSAPWLLTFAFALGFGTTFAEPALIAIADKAASLQSFQGSEAEIAAVRETFAFWLRVTVAFAVGLALVIGALRIVFGWPLHYLIIGGYVLIVIFTPLAPETIVALAYDSGGVTTSTITVPLTTALGIGLASSIQGRNPLLDGFGLIALASLTPILFVLGFGMVWT
jgi:hypothetical protein